MKLHRIQASRTCISVLPGFRCGCGHMLKGQDFDIGDNAITLDCPRCFRRLIAIEIEHMTEVD